jgi:hypothetical protein
MELETRRDTFVTKYKERRRRRFVAVVMPLNRGDKFQLFYEVLS